MRLKKAAAGALFALVISMGSSSDYAQAEYKVTGVGVVGAARPSFQLTEPVLGGVTTETDSNAGLEYGFGALLELPAPLPETFDLGSAFGIETGLLFLRRGFTAETSVPSLNVRGDTKFGANYLEVPLLVRFNLPLISAGAGVYYARALGVVSTESRSGSIGAALSGAPAKEKLSYSSLNWRPWDFGFEASFALAWPLAPTLSAVLDGRALFGLVDIDKSSGVERKFRDLRALAGVRFML